MYDLVLKTYEGMFNNLRNDDTKSPFVSVGESFEIALAFLAKQYGYKDISGEAYDLSIDIYAHQSNLFLETKTVLDKLLKNNVRMIIASDNDLKMLKVQMLKHDLAKYFTGYCVSEAIKAYKPTVRFIVSLKKYVSNDPSNYYIVGDMPFDVECGKRLGIKSVLMDRKNAKLDLSADYVINDLHELLLIMGLG